MWLEPPGGAGLRRDPALPCFARGKQSIEADLRSARGRQRVWGLAGSADALIESFRPGTEERRGLGFDALLDANPRFARSTA